MSRRPLVLFVLAIASFVVAGCSDVSTAPHRDDVCKSGYVGSSGHCE